MNGGTDMRGSCANRGKAAAALLVLAALAACSANEQLAASRPEPQPAAAPAAPPPPPSPPPVAVAGRWKFTAASGGGCFMTFGAASPTAVTGTVAPEGGCPGAFFTSRKWTFEHGELIVRNHKAEPLAQLSYAGGHFEGHETGGAAVTLSR
jgi:hypothetical protein